MPRSRVDDFNHPAPILFQRWSDEFGALMWSTGLGGPFDVSNLLQAMVVEAGAQGKGIILMAALVPTEILYATESPADTQEVSDVGTDPEQEN